MLFYSALDLNNQKILCLLSIYEFERKLGFWTTLAYCPNIYCDIYRQGRSSSILMNKTCTNDLLKVFVIHGQDNSWLTWNINAQWKNLHILFNNHKLSCTLSAALGVKTSAYFLNRKMPIKVKFKCCFGFFGLWIIWFCI